MATNLHIVKFYDALFVNYDFGMSICGHHFGRRHRLSVMAKLSWVQFSRPIESQFDGWRCLMRILKASGLKRFGVQLASDGAWERAVNVADCTGDWIHESGENIAIEAVYVRPSGELAGFVGFRKTISDPVERCAFWQSVVSNTPFSEPDTPSTQVSIWLKDLNLS